MIQYHLCECSYANFLSLNQEVLIVEVLKTIITVLFMIDCVILTVIVLMQEGKQAGLGAISGAAETYWGKNKGRSMEGALEKTTKILAVVFFIAALVLNLKWWN